MSLVFCIGNAVHANEFYAGLVETAKELSVFWTILHFLLTINKTQNSEGTWKTDKTSEVQQIRKIFLNSRKGLVLRIWDPEREEQVQEIQVKGAVNTFDITANERLLFIGSASNMFKILEKQEVRKIRRGERYLKWKDAFRI